MFLYLQFAQMENEWLVLKQSKTHSSSEAGRISASLENMLIFQAILFHFHELSEMNLIAILHVSTR